MNDPYDLRRFIEAQQRTYDEALAELRRGRKVGHWMWFIFPQIAGLGSSPTAQRYAISSLDEARAYLSDPVLGPRLRACTQAVTQHAGHSAHEIFGAPDDLKFRSSMTLFAEAAPADPIFMQALETFFKGERDPLTLEKLRSA